MEKKSKCIECGDDDGNIFFSPTLLLLQFFPVENYEHLNDGIKIFTHQL